MGSKPSTRFNESDEMAYFSKLANDTPISADLRAHYLNFLRRCKFPTEPVQCAVSGRWFDKMFKCPSTKNIYMSRHCQKQGWARNKQGKPVAKEYKGDLLKDSEDTF